MKRILTLLLSFPCAPAAQPDDAALQNAPQAVERPDTKLPLAH